MRETKDISTASPEYRQFIRDLKSRVVSARISAARSVNGEMILLYWDIGQGIDVLIASCEEIGRFQSCDHGRAKTLTGCESFGCSGALGTSC
jgi:hypothetical protein